MLLSTLGIVPESESFHPNFKLRVYASFMSRDEAIALELMEALQKV